MVRVGLVGCGGIAPLHLRVYQRIKDVEVAGVCDISLEKAKNLATRFRIERTFSDYWDLFELKDLELVDICTPVTTHLRIVCDASKTVPAILVEKPMALNIAQCDEMIEEVKKHGSKLCVGHNQIFSPLIQKAKSLVDSGAFSLLSFRTTCKENYETLKALHLLPAWNVAPEQRGIIWESVCHLAYLQLHFLPDIREVYAVGSKFKYPVYDNLSVLLRTGTERFGIIEHSWLSKETDIVYEFNYSNGLRAQIQRDFDYFSEFSEDPPFTVGTVARNILVDEKRILQKWIRFGTCYFKKTKVLPTFNLVSRYIESIKKDLPPPVAPKDGRDTINLLECIEKSLTEREPVRLGT